MTNEQTAGSSREERIIAAACRELGVAWEDIASRKRDLETATSRKLLYYVLSKGGYTIAHIAATLARHHSTVVDGLKKVQRDAALASEGQRLTEIVLPFDGAATDGAVPLATISRALVRALQDVAPAREIAAVRAYVCGTLLGREQVPSTQAAWGLCVLALRPEWRTRVEELLVECQLPAFCGLIDVQLQRAGMRTCTAREHRQAHEAVRDGGHRVVGDGRSALSTGHQS